MRLPPGTGRPATDWPAPRRLPTCYPGSAPDHDYLLVDGRVVPLCVRWSVDGVAVELADGTPVDDVLRAAGVAPLAERVPVLAYGANRSPHTLALKLGRHGDTRARGTVAVPVLAAALDDLDVVAAGLSSQGYLCADLAPSAGTRVAVMVTLLDAGQAVAIHRSEGIGAGRYACAWVRDVALAGGAGRLDALAYAGCRPVFVSPEAGTPLAFSAIAAVGRRFRAVDQVALLAHVLVSTGVVGEVAALVGARDRAGGVDPVGVARAMARLLNDQWWHTRDGSGVPSPAAARIEALVADAIARHGAALPSAARLDAAGDVVPPDIALAVGPALRLGAQLAIGGAGDR